AGKYLTVLKGQLGSIGALAFKPNGHVLASGSADRTILLWDMGDYQDPAKTNPLLASELDELWQQLASPDPVKGLEAVTRLALGGPEVAVGVAKRLSRVRPTGSKRLAQLIADLDSARFPVRRAAAA